MLLGRFWRWLRATEAVEPTADGVASFDLRDLYVANAVQAECEARGLTVQVVKDEDGPFPGVGGFSLGRTATFRLLVRVEDLDEVRAILAKQEQRG